MNRKAAWSPVHSLADPGTAVVAEMLCRAASPTFDDWWAKVADSGFCASPVRLVARGNGSRPVEVMGRCKNRRASVCPSCSQLYAGDTWQLVHGGIRGTEDQDLSLHPMVFATLTAPSFGAVHRAHRDLTTGIPVRCHPGKSGPRCGHDRFPTCRLVHDRAEPIVGQPVCVDCYDYRGHVLFNWHAPELWHRFGIALRRLVARRYRAAGHDPKAVRVSYVKIAEMQQRGLVHFHTVVRLDGIGPNGHLLPPDPALDAGQLVGLVHRAATVTKLDVTANQHLVTLRFGHQIDVQPLKGGGNLAEAVSAGAVAGRRVAAYLAKYVTKSVADFGLHARRLHAGVINDLDVTDHVRQILRMIVALSQEPERRAMSSALHTLGYRGHVTTKTRQYSTTMGELRTRRDVWRRSQREPNGKEGQSIGEANQSAEMDWRYVGCGHVNDGERLLAISAAGRASEARRTAREELADQDRVP